jgi:anaerobic C4-dicarboxylate transporter
LELAAQKADPVTLMEQLVAILFLQQLHHPAAVAVELITAQVVQAAQAAVAVELVQVVVALQIKAEQAVSVLPTVPPIDPLAAAAVHLL